MTGKLVSYAHNLEDVLLQRCFADVENGFYVDVGASWPVETSNTYGLYTRGWSGIAIDPLFKLVHGFEETWQTARPRDTLIKAAAGAAAGEVKFHLCNSLQQSTGSRRIVDYWLEQGAGIDESLFDLVPTVALSDLIARDVHLLAIDVEGMEEEVLAGLDLERHRPWLMLIECTMPGSHDLSVAWEARVLQADYGMVWNDGSNRFYLAREHDELRQWFCYPPHSLEYTTWRELALERRVKELEAQLQQ